MGGLGEDELDELDVEPDDEDDEADDDESVRTRDPDKALDPPKAQG